jgi:hypothetical protein
MQGLQDFTVTPLETNLPTDSSDPEDRTYVADVTAARAVFPFEVVVNEADGTTRCLYGQEARDWLLAWYRQHLT